MADGAYRLDPASAPSLLDASGSGEVAELDGALDGKPLAGLTVYGTTRQNLIPAMATKVVNGVSVSADGGGGVALSGTATAATWVDVTAKFFTMRTGQKYTLVIEGPFTGVNFFYVYEMDGSGESVGEESSKRVLESGVPLTFTVSDAMKSAVIGVQISAGATVSGTYRVMLAEGSEPAPWCPPGLTSVAQGASIIASPDLLDASLWEQGSFTVTATSGSYESAKGDDGTRIRLRRPVPVPSGAASVRFRMASNWYAFVSFTKGGDLVARNPSQLTGGSWSTLALPEGADGFVAVLLMSGSPYITVANLPASEVSAGGAVPLPLGSYGLRSLPDGTRDELRVGVDGRARLVQRVRAVTIDGTGVKAVDIQNGNQLVFGITDARKESVAYDFIACDSLPVTSGDNVWSGAVQGVSHNGGGSITAHLDGVASTGQANEWFSQNPTTVLYRWPSPWRSTWEPSSSPNPAARRRSCGATPPCPARSGRARGRKAGRAPPSWRRG